MSIFVRFLYYLLKIPNLKKIKKYSSDIKFGNFCNFSFYPKLKNISLGKNISIRNYCNILVADNATLLIEDNVFINNYCSINCLDKIEIGENTLFGEGVKIYDHNHQYSEEKVEHKKFNTAPIKIGKNCWIGSNAVILKGSTIGDNSIVGAGCIVHKNIPANSIIINKQETILKGNKI